MNGVKAIRRAVRKIDRMIAEAAEAAAPSGFRGLLESIRSQLRDAARMLDKGSLAGVRFHTGRARQLAKDVLYRVCDEGGADLDGIADEPVARDYGDGAECLAELKERIKGDVKFKTGPLEMAIGDLAVARRRGDMDGAARLARRALAMARDIYGYAVELNELAERAWGE